MCEKYLEKSMIQSKYEMFVCYNDNDYCTKAFETFERHHVLTYALISLYSF